MKRTLTLLIISLSILLPNGAIAESTANPSLARLPEPLASASPAQTATSGWFDGLNAAVLQSATTPAPEAPSTPIPAFWVENPKPEPTPTPILPIWLEPAAPTAAPLDTPEPPFWLEPDNPAATAQSTAALATPEPPFWLATATPVPTTRPTTRPTYAESLPPISRATPTPTLRLTATAAPTATATPTATPAPESTADADAAAAGTAIGFVQVSGESAWRAANTTDITAALAQAGYSLSYYESSSGDQAAQIAAIRKCIAANAKAVVLTPTTQTGWDDVLAELNAAGIPLILLDRVLITDDPALNWATCVRSDFTEQGRRAANWLINYGARLDAVRVVELKGTPRSAAAEGRATGFAETMATAAISSAGNVNVVASVSCDFTRNGAKQAMAAVLQQGSDVNAVFAHNDDMALGAAEAIQEAGLVPGQDVLVIGVGATDDALQGIAEGRINCTIECSPYMGAEVVEVLGGLLSGGRVGKQSAVVERVFDAEGGTACGADVISQSVSPALSDRDY